MRRMLLIALLTLLPLAGRAEAPVTVFAAASLTDALTDAAAAWAAAGHPKPRLAFASSAALARQIGQGAPAALFASADEQWMDVLDRAGLLAPNTRADLLANQLVLIVPHDRAGTVAPTATELTVTALAALLGPDGRLALGDPAAVPAGIYARQALEHLGLWEAARTHLAPTADVRSALLLVERGEAAAGIVYATDAMASRGVAVAATFPPDTHAPITYPFALVRANASAEARALLDFLRGPAARRIFVARGFRTPP